MRKWILVLMCLLTACAPIKHYYIPAVDTTVSKEVGETLIEDGWGVEYDCSYINTDMDIIVEADNVNIKYTLLKHFDNNF